VQEKTSAILHQSLALASPTSSYASTAVILRRVCVGIRFRHRDFAIELVHRANLTRLRRKSGLKRRIITGPKLVVFQRSLVPFSRTAQAISHRLPFVPRRRSPSKPNGACLRPASHYGKALRF